MTPEPIQLPRMSRQQQGRAWQSHLDQVDAQLADRRAAAEGYGMLRDGVVDVAAAGFVKLPLALADDVIANGTNQHELDDAVVAGFILRMWELSGASPTMSQLCELSGMCWDLVDASTERLAKRGLLTRRKVPYSYDTDAAGNDVYSAKWTFEIPSNSPLREMMRATTKGRRRRTWIPVPWEVARGRSRYSIAAYLLLAEQQLIDKAAVTTPSQLARVLGCHRDTARRALDELGATPIREGGRIIAYAIETVFMRGRKAPEHVELHGVELDVFGNRDRLLQRLAEVRRVLARNGVDPDTATREAMQLVAASGARGHLGLVVRVLEERHLTVMLRDPATSGRITRLFSWRLRGLGKALRTLRTKERRQEERRVVCAVHVAMAGLETASCPTCQDDAMVELPDGSYAPCPTCRGGT